MFSVGVGATFWGRKQKKSRISGHMKVTNTSEKGHKKSVVRTRNLVTRAFELEGTIRITKKRDMRYI